MKSTFTLLAFALAFVGCSTPQASGLRADPRAGTDATPYRTIPSTIQCDDCRMPAER